ncbi:MAG: hypothetical protein JW957_02370 [Candidatus Omnitrophica bacterium]|nr:hypothetical protein [Candidatus Omnitrophota bacterium]
MTEEILEDVEVGAVFGRSGVRPGWFVWNGRRYPVEKVNYVWHDKNGEEVIYYFSVAAGANMYELSFYTGKLKWMLERIYVEG